MVFAVGIGDAIAVAQLVARLCGALDDAVGSLADYRSLMDELYAFHRAVMEVEKIARENRVPESVKNSLLAIVASGRAPIEQCLEDIDAYRKVFGRPGVHWGNAVIKKFGWSLIKAGDVMRLRHVVLGLCSSIQLLLQASGA